MIKDSIPMIRRQMELANILCKGHIAFVVIPVVDDTDHQTLLQRQQERLDAITQEGGA